MTSASEEPIAHFASLSKSRYVAGWQCLKRLYYQTHRRDLMGPPDEATQAIFDQGHLVGALAQRAFPGGVLVAEEYYEHDAAIVRTQALMGDPSVPAIFEAAFTYEQIRVRVDVLLRLPSGNWRLIEVKQSTQVKDYHLHDMAIQRYVVEGCGLKVAGCDIMHINNQYVYAGGDHDPLALFMIEDVDARMGPASAMVPGLLEKQRHVLAQPTEPDIPPGTQCEHPYACEFQHVCCKPLPVDHVSLLPRASARRLAEWGNAGIKSMRELSPGPGLSALQERAIRSCLANAPVFETAGANAMPPRGETIVFMDFESYATAVPLHPGTRPYQQIPFQWSIMVQPPEGGALENYDFLAEDEADPRRAFLESLLCVLEAHPGRIVVYSQAFEEARLRDLGVLHPDCAHRVKAACTRLWDLLPFVRNHSYHPEFRGSFSIKAVYPALIDPEGYDKLVVQDGSQAGAVFLRTLSPDCDEAERQAHRNHLIEYCRLDVMAMVRLLDFLREKTSSSP